MMYNNLYQLNVKKLCVVHVLNEKGQKEFYTAGLFDPNMGNEELMTLMVSNSSDMHNKWLNNKLDVEFKNVNAPDDWGYCPSDYEELNILKENYLLH